MRSSTTRTGARTCSCPPRSGARRRERSPTSKDAYSASHARSRPRARRWMTGASRSSSPCASAPLEPEGEAGSDEDVAAGDAAAAAAAEVSTHAEELAAPLLRWDRQVGDGAVPSRDAYALRLVSVRPLYDAGRGVVSSPSIA